MVLPALNRGGLVALETASRNDRGCDSPFDRVSRATTRGLGGRTTRRISLLCEEGATYHHYSEPRLR
jgi:hypothetical protein